MASLADRVAQEFRRERKPLEVRKALLELAARAVYAPAWLLGRLGRGVVVAARFAWGAARLGLVDGYRGGPQE